MNECDSREYTEGADVLFTPATENGEMWNPFVARFDASCYVGSDERCVYLQLIRATDFMAAPTDGITAPKTDFESDPSAATESDTSSVSSRQRQLQDYPHDESSLYAQNMVAPTCDDYRECGIEGQRIEIPYGRRKITVCVVMTCCYHALPFALADLTSGVRTSGRSDRRLSGFRLRIVG